jgi:hypothetical protein
MEDFDKLVALENSEICSLTGETLEEAKVCCHSKSLRKSILEQKTKSPRLAIEDGIRKFENNLRINRE